MVESAAGLLATGTRLYYKSHEAVAFTEVANVKTTPEVGAAPQQLEITNLGDENQRYDLGMNNSAILAFTAIYKGPQWNTIYQKAGDRKTYDWKLVYPDGMTITFTGSFQITLAGMDVNTAAAYTISISPTAAPQFHKSDSSDSSSGEEGEDDTMSYRPMFTKTFGSVIEMNAFDNSNDDLITGDFVLVSGTDADRGKVYFYNGGGFTFFANILGPQGVKGDKGDPGLSVRMKGQVASLPALANEGDNYFVGTELYAYTNGKWIDLGNFQGKQGIQGVKGDKGDTGSQGPKGDIGATGSQGIQGIKGDKGDTGSQGPKGDIGLTGPQGPQGQRGIQGEKGDMPSLTGVATSSDVTNGINSANAYTDNKTANTVKTNDTVNWQKQAIFISGTFFAGVVPDGSTYANYIKKNFSAAGVYIVRDYESGMVTNTGQPLSVVDATLISEGNGYYYSTGVSVYGDFVYRAITPDKDTGWCAAISSNTKPLDNGDGTITLSNGTYNLSSLKVN